MHLVSLVRQSVRIGSHRFDFEPGESIHTENSYKYSIDGFRQLAAQAGYAAPKSLTDRKGLFALHALRTGSARFRRKSGQSPASGDASLRK